MDDKQPLRHSNLLALNRRFVGVLAAIFLIVVLLLGRPFAALSDNSLLTPVTGRAAVKLGTVEAARRARAVHINWNALDPQSDELRLNLFEDLSLTANLRRVDPSVTGGYIWVGDIIGETGGTVTLSVQDGVLAGSIYRLGREWGFIRYAGEALDDVYWIIEVDPLAPQPTGLDYMIPQPSPVEARALTATQGAACVEDGSVIDLMVVYTPAARDAAGGQAAIEALMNQRVSDMNIANDASAATFDWQLVHMMEVDYTEAGSLATDLQFLQATGDGVLESVHAARDTYQADFVAMIVSEGNNNACGFAYQMSTLESWFQGYSFGVSALEYPGQYTCSPLTLAHEFGHNLGNAHDRDHTAGPVIFPYSYGYQSPNETFRTIMSYDCPNGCPRINQWANPDIWYEGEPTGVDFETDPDNAADIVRSMDQSKVLASNFRADCSVLPSATPTEEPNPTETSTPIETSTPTDTPIPTDTPTPTEIPTDPPQPTATPPPTTAPNPTPTSEVNTPLPELLYLPAVIQK